MHSTRAARSLTAGSWQPLTAVQGLEGLGATGPVTVREALPLGSSPHRFYRWPVRWQ